MLATWSKTSLTLHKSDNIQISKISTPTFNKVIRAYLQGVNDGIFLFIMSDLYENEPYIAKIGQHTDFLNFNPYF